jgi:probable HAF family extracellular repeat protein
MRDLGAVDGDLCSAAWSINEAGQIVGNSAPECDFFTQTRAFLWERGQVFDLNMFVAPGSDLYLSEADFINDRGDITGPAFLPSGEVHQYLLLRCGANKLEGCVESGEHVTRSVRDTPSRTRTQQKSRITRFDRDAIFRVRDELQK